MEQNYTEKLSQNALNADSILMLQVVGDDHELYMVDLILREAFGGSKALENC